MMNMKKRTKSYTMQDKLNEATAKQTIQANKQILHVQRV